MLNKKAIAAFAAGATLLAGFAVSAPAFAETNPGDTATVQPAAPKKDEKKDSEKPAAEQGSEAKKDDSLYTPEDADALAKRLQAEKDAADAKKAQEEYENADYGEKNHSPYWKKLMGEDQASKKDAKKDEKVAPKKEVKKGATLAKTGVSVALTALAASVLAGVGAAVRKFRH